MSVDLGTACSLVPSENPFSLSSGTGSISPSTSRRVFKRRKRGAIRWARRSFKKSPLLLITSNPLTRSGSANTDHHATSISTRRRAKCASLKQHRSAWQSSRCAFFSRSQSYPKSQISGDLHHNGRAKSRRLLSWLTVTAVIIIVEVAGSAMHPKPPVMLSKVAKAQCGGFYG